MAQVALSVPTFSSLLIIFTIWGSAIFFGDVRLPTPSAPVPNPHYHPRPPPHPPRLAPPHLCCCSQFVGLPTVPLTLFSFGACFVGVGIMAIAYVQSGTFGMRLEGDKLLPRPAGS